MVVIDTQFEPAIEATGMKRLVEQDKVFAVFNSVGTANNLAVRDYLNAQKVPQLFAADGSQSIGRDYARYPWTMGFLQSYVGEGAVYAVSCYNEDTRHTYVGKGLASGETLSVFIGDELIPVRNVFWAAGVKASPLGKSLGVPLDRDRLGDHDRGRSRKTPPAFLTRHPCV